MVTKFKATAVKDKFSQKKVFFIVFIHAPDTDKNIPAASGFSYYPRDDIGGDFYFWRRTTVYDFSPSIDEEFCLKGLFGFPGYFKDHVF